MSNFNKRYIMKEIGTQYCKIFPNKKITPSIVSYGFKNDKTKKITNTFFCIDPNYELIGFAIHYSSKKILRFYNHEGEDIGLKINMDYRPLEKRRFITKI